MSRAPSAITPAKKRALMDAFADGATQRIACGVARVAPRTFQTWMRRGHDDLNEWAEECEALADDLEPGDPAPDWPKPTTYAGFYLEVAQSLAQRDLEWMRALRGTSAKEQGQWQRYAWLLERTSPGEFALKDTARLDPTAEGGPAKIEDRSASLADVARVLEAVGALALISRGADRPEVPADRALLPAPRNS